MSEIRKEVSAFAAASEYLISDFVYPPLTKDEEALINYYIAEVVRHFEFLRSGKMNGV